MSDLLHGFLADTWWYAMTARLPDEDFRRLVELRVNQRFNAAQVVVGVPPETTPENPNAASPFGAAWTRAGLFNTHYLAFARERIQTMNDAGLRAIVYGAWGPQINWLGVERMVDWWKAVILHTSDLDVIYCLTGESNLQVGLSDLPLFHKWPGLQQLIGTISGRSHLFNRVIDQVFRAPVMIQERRRAWSRVLENVAPLTQKPFIIHPNPQETGFECVDNPQLLAANTAQTGHSPRSRPRLYQLPLAHASAKDTRGRGFINLEPWYEGIRDMFYGEDQLFAYWVNMLAGAISHCYGAHGVWNVGDGAFLNHWGSRTFSEALSLDTPRLLGLSHGIFQSNIGLPAEVKIVEENGSLRSIQRNYADGTIIFIPEIGQQKELPIGQYWLPMEGRFTDHPPLNGQIVIFNR